MLGYFCGGIKRSPICILFSIFSKYPLTPQYDHGPDNIGLECTPMQLYVGLAVATLHYHFSRPPSTAHYWLTLGTQCLMHKHIRRRFEMKPIMYGGGLSADEVCH